MGTTLTMLNAAGGAVDYVVQIEGYDALLTTGNPAHALTAWQAALNPGNTSVTRAFGGLGVTWDQATEVGPWEPFGQPPICRLTVVPGRSAASSTVVDTFAEEVFKRSGGAETTLAASLTPTSSTVTVRTTTGFGIVGATGTLHIGPEAIGYTIDTATTFTPLARASYVPFATDIGDPFARSHVVRDLSTATGDPVGVDLPPIVSDEWRTWVGRWVGVWICRRTASGIDGPDQGHLAFAGTIAGVEEGEDGATRIDLEHVLRRIYETRIMPDPYTATLADGIYLGVLFSATATDNQFRFSTERAGTTWTANPLTIVSGAPAGVDEIQEGTYTAEEIGQAITAWLQAEYTAGRIHYATDYAAAFSTASGPRGRLHAADATAGSVNRRMTLILPDGDRRLQDFLGWSSLTIATGIGGVSDSITSPNPPQRIAATYRLPVVNERGTWINQGTLLPPILQDASGLQEGIVKIGSLGHAVVSYEVGGYFLVKYPTRYLNRYLTAVEFASSGAIVVPLDDDQPVTVQQVLVVEGEFQSILLRMLMSTGASGHNSATYDTLPAGLACAIPYSLMGASFVTDTANVDGANDTICMVVDKPTRWVDLFNVDFILRFAFLTWGAGRLHLKPWGTPTTLAATVALTEANKGIDANAARSDKQRSGGDERFEFLRNNVTIKYARDATGELVSSLSIPDLHSMAAHGDRGIVLEARNTLGQSAIGDMAGLLVRFSATLPLFSRPHKVIRRTVMPSLFEQLVPGTIVTITDNHIRDPETGLRGITGWPGIVVENRHDWGGSMPGTDGRATHRPANGEIAIMIYDRVTAAGYSPAAQVDHTVSTGGYSAGYDNGTKTLKTVANAYSASGAAEDASHFAAGDFVRILEIDPPNPAAALTWLREIASISTTEIVLTTTLSAPAWDATKKYRIVPDSYANVDTSQQDTAYQADDADGLVSDQRQPYGMISGGAQAATFAPSAATELPARYAAEQIGDGVPFDTGAARDLARLANNLISYRTAAQNPTVYSEARSDTPSGSWKLTEIAIVFVGVGELFASVTRKYYVAPTFRSKSGASVSMRLSLCRTMPLGSSRDDVSLTDPYVSTTFTTSSTSYTTPTAVGLDVRHLALAPGGIGGIGFLCVEVDSGDCEYIATSAEGRVGPQEAP